MGHCQRQHVMLCDTVCLGEYPCDVLLYLPVQKSALEVILIVFFNSHPITFLRLSSLMRSGVFPAACLDACE